jgi:DNA-binding XRE family transcriptional regulator
MTKTINPVIENIVSIIKSSNLTFEERLAVVQDVKIIKQYYKSDKMDLLSGLNKINETISKTKGCNVKFISYVGESIKDLREELSPQLMKSLCEADENIGADKEGNLQKGEGESELDFKKRQEEQEKIQDKNVDAFQQAQEKMKKGETKPLAKALRAKGMSQQELADKLDVHKSTISRLKTGKRNPSFEMMAELGETLGSVENLFPELK